MWSACSRVTTAFGLDRLSNVVTREAVVSASWLGGAPHLLGFAVDTPLIVRV